MQQEVSAEEILALPLSHPAVLHPMAAKSSSQPYLRRPGANCSPIVLVRDTGRRVTCSAGDSLAEETHVSPG